jgi:hypothetical protein
VRFAQIRMRREIGRIAASTQGRKTKQNRSDVNVAKPKSLGVDSIDDKKDAS